MITLDIFGPGPNKKLDEAVGLDRSKVPNYPRDPATVQHRIDTAKAILSDPKSDPDSRQAAAAILAQHKDIKEYGDTARGQKMLTKVQKRAVDRMIKADDKRDAKAAKKNQDTANRAWDRMTDKDVAEGVEIIDQDYDMDQQIFKINVDGKTLQFTYWDYDENWANPDIKEIYAQVQDRLTGLSPQQQKAVAKAVYRAVKQDAIKEDAAGVQSNIDTSSPNFNHLLYMLRNDYPVPRGRLINKVMMNGQWLDPDEIKELVKSNQLWKGLGYGQEGYNVRGQGPGEKVYEQGIAKQPVNEISPHDYDSDEDYYAALRGRRRPSYNDDYDFDPELDRPQDDGDDESYYEKYVRTKGLEERQAAGKKKDSEPEVTDVELQRAISKSRAAFPTAQSGVQALMKDFMQGQEKDQNEFEKVRRADRRQDQLLAQISKVDKDQEQELQDLDKENNTLAQRLSQLQAVNDRLEKQLAAMSGRKPKTKGATEPASVSIEPALSKPVAKDTHKPAKKSKSPSKSKSVGAISKQLTAPKKADSIAAMTQRIKHGDQSITNKLTGQQALDFDKTNDPYAHILDPSIPRRLTRLRDKDPANIVDVTPKRARDVTDFSKQDISNISSPTDVPDKTDTLRKTAYDVGMSENQKQDQEADYGNEYQDMVARVGQKAREQEKKKPVDIKDLARRLAAVKLKDEK